MHHRYVYGVFVLLAAGWVWTASAQEAVPAVQAVEAAKPAGKLYQLFADDIEKSVSEALQQDGAGEKVQATVVGRRTLPLYESDKALEVEIKTLRFDAQTQKWSANLMFMHEGKVESAMPISGRYQEMVSVPVLKRRMEATDVITEADTELKDYPLNRTRKDIVLDASQIVGKSPRRTVSPNRPIRTDELGSPQLLAKDAIVRMRYESNGILVETTGQAMDSGGKGDLVRVRNLDSKAVVQGMVEEKNLVRVMLGGQVSQPVTAAPAKTQ